jgi:phage gp37-like protein
MSLDAAEKAILATIKERLKAAKIDVGTIDTHGGKFAPGDLANLGKKTPAVLLTVIGFDDVELRAAGWCAQTEYVITIVTGDQVGKNRSTVAKRIASGLACLAKRKGQLWGSAEAFLAAPHGVVAKNLYDGKMDKEAGMVIWIVRFEQLTVIDERDLDGVDDLLTVNATYDTNGDGAPEAEDTYQMRQP